LFIIGCSKIVSWAMVTPLVLFIGCKIGRLSLGRGGIAIVPYLVAEIIILFLITYIPTISMLLPSLMGYA